MCTEATSVITETFAINLYSLLFSSLYFFRLFLYSSNSFLAIRLAYIRSPAVLKAIKTEIAATKIHGNFFWSSNMDGTSINGIFANFLISHVWQGPPQSTP